MQQSSNQPYVIEHEQKERELRTKNSLHPIELEAIAKVSKVVHELNKVLQEQDFETVHLYWVAEYDGGIAAEPNPDFPDMVRF